MRPLAVCLAIAVVIAAIAILPRVDNTPSVVTDATTTSPAKTSTPDSSSTSTTVKAPVLAPIETGALRLEGQAIDDRMQPIAGATITLAGQRSVTTEADGSFAFDGLAEGTYSLTGERAELFGETIDERLDDSSDPIMLTMRHGPMLVVHVRELGTGKPIAGAQLEGSITDRQTDADGTARFRGLEMREYWVVIKAPGFAPQRHHVSMGAQPSATVERTFTLGPATTLAGMVVDEQGKPVPKARVKIEAPLDSWGDDVETDDNGRFQFDAVGTGAHVLRASSDTHLETTDQVVELDGRTPRKDIVVRVKMGSEVAGVVVDASGRPVGGAVVRASWGRAESDDAGRFILRGLEPGELEVYAETPTSASTHSKITLDKRADVRLVLATSSIAGIVRDTNGMPVESASISLKNPLTEVNAYAMTDEHGRFDSEGIPPGEYEVYIDRYNEPSRESRPLARVKSPRRDLAFVLPMPVKIKGRVVFAGKPVSMFGFAVVEDTERSSGSPDVVQHVDGKFESVELSPGKWAVVIAGTNFRRKVIGNIVANGVVDLGDVVVEPGRALKGRVVDERGVAIANADVLATNNYGYRDDTSLSAVLNGNRSASTDQYGRYAIEGLEPGETVRIRARTESGMSAEYKVPENVETFDITLVSAGAIAGRITHMGARQILVRAKSIRDEDDEYVSYVDASGGFAFERMPAGMYEVSVSGENVLRPQRVRVDGSRTSQVVFEMPERPVSLAVRAKECSVIELKQDGQQIALELCKDDVATFTQVPAGEFEVCSGDSCTTLVLVADRPRQEITIPIAPPEPEPTPDPDPTAEEEPTPDP